MAVFRQSPDAWGVAINTASTKLHRADFNAVRNQRPRVSMTTQHSTPCSPLTCQANQTRRCKQRQMTQTAGIAAHISALTTNFLTDRRVFVSITLSARPATAHLAMAATPPSIQRQKPINTRFVVLNYRKYQSSLHRGYPELLPNNHKQFILIAV